jgi:hypothetical protein
MNGRRRVLTVAAAAGVLVGSYLTYRAVYAGPRDHLLRRLGEDREAILAYEQALKETAKVTEGLKAMAARCLGSTPEKADATFRDDLFAVADRCGLRGVEVTTTAPQGMRNPAGDARLKSTLSRELRKQVDFQVITGSVKGQGTLEQAIRTAATIQAQPWAHRVESFSLKPLAKDKDRFDLSLGVSTMILPDLAPRDFRPPDVAALGDSAAERWAALVRKNVFREPPPPPPATAQAPEKPPSPPAPSPYADWKLTGVVASRLGVEAWLVNTRSNERLTLSVGAALAEAKFLSGEGERAVFEIGGQKFEVVNGQTLDQRRPVN